MVSLGNTYNEEDLYDFDLRVKKNIDSVLSKRIQASSPLEKEVK